MVLNCNDKNWWADLFNAVQKADKIRVTHLKPDDVEYCQFLAAKNEMTFVLMAENKAVVGEFMRNPKVKKAKV